MAVQALKQLEQAMRVRGVEADPLACAGRAHEKAAALGVRNGGEVDSEIGAPSPGERGPDQAQHVSGLDDAHLIDPRLAQHGGRVLSADDEGDVGAREALTDRSDRGHVQKEVTELILGAEEVDSARFGFVERSGRRGHAPEPEADWSRFNRIFSISRTLTRRSWQEGGICGSSQCR